ncbi:MAG: hypothetical protein N2517_08940 [Ignavibacteria bacterium]|nr:hypothetical protein [Ignavibacteria bacterium]
MMFLLVALFPKLIYSDTYKKLKEELIIYETKLGELENNLADILMWGTDINGNWIKEKKKEIEKSFNKLENLVREIELLETNIDSLINLLEPSDRVDFNKLFSRRKALIKQIFGEGFEFIRDKKVNKIFQENISAFDYSEGFNTNKLIKTFSFAATRFNNVPMYQLPNSNSIYIALLSQTDRIRIISSYEQWSYIEVNGTFGWVETLNLIVLGIPNVKLEETTEANIFAKIKPITTDLKVFEQVFSDSNTNQLVNYFKAKYSESIDLYSVVITEGIDFNGKWIINKINNIIPLMYEIKKIIVDLERKYQEFKTKSIKGDSLPDIRSARSVLDFVLNEVKNIYTDPEILKKVYERYYEGISLSTTVQYGIAGANIEKKYKSNIPLIDLKTSFSNQKIGKISVNANYLENLYLSNYKNMNFRGTWKYSNESNTLNLETNAFYYDYSDNYILNFRRFKEFGVSNLLDYSHNEENFSKIYIEYKNLKNFLFDTLNGNNITTSYSFFSDLTNFFFLNLNLLNVYQHSNFSETSYNFLNPHLSLIFSSDLMNVYLDGKLVNINYRNDLLDMINPESRVKISMFSNSLNFGAYYNNIIYKNVADSNLHNFSFFASYGFVKDYNVLISTEFSFLNFSSLGLSDRHRISLFTSYSDPLLQVLLQGSFTKVIKNEFDFFSRSLVEVFLKVTRKFELENKGFLRVSSTPSLWVYLNDNEHNSQNFYQNNINIEFNFEWFNYLTNDISYNFSTFMKLGYFFDFDINYSTKYPFSIGANLSFFYKLYQNLTLSYNLTYSYTNLFYKQFYENFIIFFKYYRNSYFSSYLNLQFVL